MGSPYAGRSTNETNKKIKEQIKVNEAVAASDPNRAVYGRFGVNPDDKQAATKLQGEITRAEFDDYMKTFPSIHKQLINSVSTPTLLNEQLARNQNNVNHSFSLAHSQLAENNREMGLAAPEQPSKLKMSLAKVAADNNTRLHAKDRELNAIAGSSSAMGAS